MLVGFFLLPVLEGDKKKAASGLKGQSLLYHGEVKVSSRETRKIFNTSI